MQGAAVSGRLLGDPEIAPSLLCVSDLNLKRNSSAGRRFGAAS
jgi:hypothetical protein